MAEHEHDFRFATVMMQAREHVITKQPMQRPSLVMLCGCGAIRHEWVPEPRDVPAAKAPILS